MTVRFTSCLMKDFKAFLAFKRSLGYQYGREEFALREFDRFLLSYVRRRRSWRLDRAVLAWLASKPERKGPGQNKIATDVLRSAMGLRIRHLRECA
jgi:hypothetical protein